MSLINYLTHARTIALNITKTNGILNRLGHFLSIFIAVIQLIDFTLIDILSLCLW